MLVKSLLSIFLLFSSAGVALSGIFSCWFMEFACDNDRCVEIGKVCDGVDDCGDGSDENTCHKINSEKYEERSNQQFEESKAVTTEIFPKNDVTVELGSPSQTVTATPDSKLVVQCRDGNFGKNRLNWYKPEGELPYDSFVKDGRLVIPTVGCEDAGSYICYRDGQVIKGRDYAVIVLEVDQKLCSNNKKPVSFLPTSVSSPTWMTTTPDTTNSWNVSLPSKSYSYSLPCQNESDCYKFCCNGTCVTVMNKPFNTFRCMEGSYVPVSEVCNGIMDCPDGSDENSCKISCRGNEFHCGDGNCVPLTKKCDGENDCADGTDESNCLGSVRPKLISLSGGGMEIDCVDPENQLKGSHVLQLECKFFGNPVPEVKWKKNDGHVPSKCSSISKLGTGVLVCPNFQQSDQGAYSCLGENSLGSAESQPKTVVKCNQITCINGFVVKDEYNVESCLSCFCSGRTTTCYSVPTKIASSTFSFPRTQVDMIANADGQIFMPNSSNVNSYDLKPVKYCLMPEEEVQGHKLMMSYGRNLIIPAVNKKTNFMPNAPDVIITGRGVMLKYSFNMIEQNSRRMNVRFWDDNWQHSDGRHASRNDIMGVLAHFEQLYIRCEYEEGVTDINKLEEITLESAVVSDEPDGVSYVEKCSCPSGYDGLSCELCAPGYKKEHSGNEICTRQTTLPKTCPVGTIGEYCEECDSMNLYYRHNKNQTCVKTTCNTKGSIGLFPDENDDCICKDKVHGVTCDTCKPGHFHLDKENYEGCKKCWCSNVVRECKSSDFRRTAIFSSISRLDGFSTSNGDNFWLLPSDFTGNLVTSYGGFIRYTMTYQSDNEKGSKSLAVEILGGNGINLRYINRNPDFVSYEGEESWSVLIEEPFWRDINDRLVTRDVLLSVLTQVKAIFVQSPYHLSSGKVKLTSVELDVAEDTSNEISEVNYFEKASKVEICECPVGYEGTSCESCSVGYYRQGDDLKGFVCAKCECDIKFCDSLQGCVICPMGKYNNNTDPSDIPVCLDCPCHGNEEFCIKDEYNLILCSCKPGYYGTKCEIEESSEGYFQVSVFPVLVLNKKVGTFVTFNCSYTSVEEHRIEFQKVYAKNPPSHSELFKVENHGWSSTLETSIEKDLASVDCNVRNLEGGVVARVSAKVIGTGVELSKPFITNCYDEPKLVTESDDAYLRCDTTGSPEPKVTWHKMEKDGSLVELNSTDGVYTIISVGLGLNGTIFTCTAQNSHGIARCTTLLLVKKRCVLSIHPMNPEVVEGESVELNCSTQSGSSVSWSRTQSPLSGKARVSGGTLFISDITMSEMGEYKCTADDGSSVKTTRLIVKKRRIPPTAMILNPDMTVLAGNSLTVLCGVTGDPEPTITWTKLGSTSFPMNIRVSQNGRELNMINAEVKDTGIYQCRAESFTNATSRILITVLEKPVIMIHPEVVLAKVGDTVEVDCIPIKGEPLTMLEWSRGYVGFGTDFLHLGGKLKIENIDHLDAGVYECNAMNEMGKATGWVTISVGTPPKVSFKPSGTIDVVPRDRIDMVCLAEGVPLPEIEWFKYQKINLGGNRYHKSFEVIAKDMNYVNVTVTEDLDSIVCSGSNKFGTTNSTLTFNVKSEIPTIPGLGKQVLIGSSVNLDFSYLGGKFNCTRQKGSMLGDECYTPNGLEIKNAQVQHTGTYKCVSNIREMSYTIKVEGFVNKFTKNDMSHLILPVTMKSHHEFQTEITFKPERQSGILLLKKKHHAFMMYMKRGKLLVRLRRHSEEITLTTKKSLELNVWHTAVFQLRNNAVLTVYNESGSPLETVTDPRAFKMSWSINVEDNLYLGGIKLSERHLPLSTVDAYFQGCVSRLIIDDHEYKITEEGKSSKNVSLCNVCSSGENPCGNDAVCYDAPTHYGFVCICGKNGCRENCKGRGCLTKINLCDTIRPCGFADNKCLPYAGGLRCHCASGYSGLTCNEKEAFEFSLNGDGFLALPGSYIPRNSIEEPEVITIVFSLYEPIPSQLTLFYQGVSLDYLRIYINEQYIVYIYENQNQKLEVRGERHMSNEYHIQVTRRNNTATLEINGLNYTETVPFTTNRVYGDIYIGGGPDQSGFIGCIHEVRIAGKRINTLAKDVTTRNIKRECKSGRFIGIMDDRSLADDDSMSSKDDFYGLEF